MEQDIYSMPNEEAEEHGEKTQSRTEDQNILLEPRSYNKSLIDCH